MNGNNLGVSVVARKKLSAKDAVDPVASDHEVESPPAKKPKLDYERIIMDQERSDTEINYAQQLLKGKHPNFKGFQSTLTMSEVEKHENNIQIAYCTRRHHWMIVTTVNCKQGEIKVLDSVFFNCDKEILQATYKLYKHISENLNIKICRYQKQAGGTDCGLFSIVFAVALVHGMNPGQLKFCQDKMRSHLVECFNKQVLVPFPCK